MQSDEPEEPISDEPNHGPSRGFLLCIALFGALAALGVLAGFLKFSHARDAIRPVVVANIPAPQAHSPQCQNVYQSYPGGMAGDWKRVKILAPEPPASAAWRRGTATIIARCGVDRPIEFVVGSPLEQINGVRWFRAADPGIASATWFAVDRGVYIALTMPDGSGSEPLVEMSDAISSAVPAIKPDPAPIPG